MRVAALAGGVGAGKLLRGLVRAVDPSDVTVIGNVGDDMVHLGLHISPDLDSVAYWLSGEMDRERGWGRAGETFRAMEELGRLGEQAWFSLGDRDLATHLHRTQRLNEGASLSDVTAELCEALRVPCRVLPVTDDSVRTWIDVQGGSLPFQMYWVAHGAEPKVERVRFEGAEKARPAAGALEAIAEADAIVICPSNPVVSVMPILAVPGVHEALRERRDRVVGISPIVGGTVLQGMADKLMPAMGLEVSAAGAAEGYRGLLAAWVVDERDRDLAPKIEEREGLRVGVTDTIMVDDEASERLASFALELLG
ncbi:MAG TPA: 2-phospho-L-lactate transferase [Actinomycetota bacterium]